MASRSTIRCATLPHGAQQNGEREARNLARRRYQKGSLLLRGKSQPVWVGRWLEDEIQQDGTLRRVHRSEVLAALKSEDADRRGIPHCPTKRLALRELQARLDSVNAPTYRARPTATFAQFASRWESTVLVQHKPSTQATIRCQLRKYLVPFFGRFAMRDIHPEMTQQFVSGLAISPKTVRNLSATLQMIWRSARTWRYVAHDALEGIVLPKRRKVQRFFFTPEEVRRVIAATEGPQRTFYWLAAETGMRAGELCGLRIEDLDLPRGLLLVRQSAWRGKIQTPKSENSVRTFALSPQLIEHLQGSVKNWRPNDARLLFASRNGTPWDANLLVKRKMHPLLAALGIQRCGLHAFRHTNSSLMDRLCAPLKVRQQRLGHSDPRLTLNVYTHVASEDDARVAAQLGELVSGIPCPNLPKLEKEGVARIEQPFVN
jgi:integrase